MQTLLAWAILFHDSTQSQLKLRLRLALIPADPPTHPPGTVVSRTSVGVLLTVSRPLNDHFMTTLRKTMPRLFKNYLNTTLRPPNPPFHTTSRLLEKLLKIMPRTPQMTTSSILFQNFCKSTEYSTLRTTI